MADIFRWLGSLSPDTAGSAIGAFFAAFLLATVARVKAHAEKARVKAYAKVEADARASSTPTMLPPPSPSIPAPVKALDVRLREMERLIRMRTEWDLDQCRVHVKELEAAYARIQQDAARQATSLMMTRRDLDQALSDVADAKAAVAQSVRDRNAADARALRAVEELGELKRAIASGHHGSAAVTPLRPGPPHTAKPRGAR